MAKSNKAKEFLGNEDYDKASADEQKAEILREQKETAEKQKSAEEEMARLQIKQEIESMNLDDGLREQASTQASKIQSLTEEEKIKKLLSIAKSKGVIYAIEVAKKMDDPFIVDIFHDLLVRQGYYKNFTK